MGRPVPYVELCAGAAFAGGAPSAAIPPIDAIPADREGSIAAKFPRPPFDGRGAGGAVEGKEGAGGGKAEVLNEVEGMGRAPRREAALEELVGACRMDRLVGVVERVGVGGEKGLGVCVCKRG